jgi:cytokinin dehydrogenase
LELFFVQDVDALLGELNFIPGTVFTTDLPYVDFLDRVHKAELKLRAKGMWEVPRPASPTSTAASSVACWGAAPPAPAVPSSSTP